MNTTYPDFRLDFSRPERLGIGEAVFCIDKSVSQLERILEAFQKEGKPALLTRLDGRKHADLDHVWLSQIDYDAASETGYFQAVPVAQITGEVAIVTAGTSDSRSAWEAARTLTFNGIGPTMIQDVGVAGIWRLSERIDEIRAYPIVIAVAGMDAALVSVLGGLVPGVIIALPTSTGYGASRQGETALNAALVSCAAGVVVCNIDNGFGAACAALRSIQSARMLGHGRCHEASE